MMKNVWSNTLSGSVDGCIERIPCFLSLFMVCAKRFRDIGLPGCPSAIAFIAISYTLSGRLSVMLVLALALVPSRVFKFTGVKR